MNSFTRIFKTYTLEEVFTPNTVAKLSYIKRDIIENDLEKYLLVPGKQIVIYGHSGGGKTTLLRNKLKEVKQNFIRTHCEAATTFDDLILQAFDELDRFYISEKNTNSSYSISSELKASYQAISSALKSSYTENEGKKMVRIVPPQLTPQKLAQFLGEIRSVWIIEDFHKVKQVEKKRIADVLKIFIDSANDYGTVKIICVGAVGTARELIQLDDNLSSRIAELYVPLLTDKEILSLIDKGSNLLNVNITNALKEKIVYYSNNLASVTHQICFDLCFHERIKKSGILSKSLKDDSFKIAVDSFVRKNSDTFNKVYEQILCQSYGWNILKTFDYKEKEYLSLTEIHNGIPIVKRPTETDLCEYLALLGSSVYNEIIRFNPNSKKYSISTPFFRAYLKMKLALEHTEQMERNKKRNKKKQRKYNICEERDNRIKKMILDDDFMKTYYQFLDSFIIKEIEKKQYLEQKAAHNKRS